MDFSALPRAEIMRLYTQQKARVRDCITTARVAYEAYRENSYLDSVHIDREMKIMFDAEALLHRIRFSITGHC